MRFEIEQGEQLLSSHSGLALVGEILNMVGLSKRLDGVVLNDHPCPEISNGDVAKAMIGLICAEARPTNHFASLVTDEYTTCI